MISINRSVGLVKLLTQLTKTSNLKPAYYLFFIFYALVKLNFLFKMQLKLLSIPEKLFFYLIMKHGKCNETQVDENLYILCNSKEIDQSKKWFYLCCTESKKKYKVIVVTSDGIPENTILVSETLKYNIDKIFNIENSDETSYFLSKFFLNTSILVTNNRFFLILYF